jgi:predicted SnoaL-like aldol condensation-catalyzing enzyme
MASPTVPGRPAPAEYAPFYETYVSKVTEDDLVAALAAQVGEIEAVLAAVSPEREGYRYAPGKWSVREMFGHLCDTERLFAYRALSIARGDDAPLPGMDENAWMEPAAFDGFPLDSLGREWVELRRTTVALFDRLDAAAWHRVGNANGQAVSVRALAAIMVGHLRHHLGILAERYGIAGSGRKASSGGAADRKAAAAEYLHWVATGRVDEAFERHAAPGFVHHNPYFPGDATSLAQGMKDNAAENPEKKLEIQRIIADADEDGDLVVVHSRVKMTPDDLGYGLVHIFRFEGDRIAEMWDLAQEVPGDSPNEHGMF